MYKRIVILIFLYCPISIYGQNVFIGDLSLGPHPVGYQTIKVRDSSRIYDGVPRPLLISVWYPAAASQESVKFEDYLFTDAAKVKLRALGSEEKSKVRQQFIGAMKMRKAKEEDLNNLLNLKTTALHNTLPIPGTFPLILSMQGGGRPASTHFILNEYLASMGYLVVSFPDIYASPNRRQNTSAQNMEALGLDMDLAISTLNAHQDFSIRRIGAIGFSRAGEAIIFHQTLKHNLDAFVAMDAQPDTDLMASLPQNKLRQINLPLLTFFSNHQKKMTLEEARADRTAFQFLPKSDKLKIRMMELNHGDQTSAGMIAAHIVENFNRWPLIGDSKLGYETICRLTLNFFDFHLKNSLQAQKLLDAPIEGLGLPDGFIVVHYRKKQ